MTTKTVPAEVGILYSARMILAYANKQKTQTRRTAGLNEINQEPDRWQLEELAKMNGAMWAHFRRDDGMFKAIKCRYGVPGETVLWTRETWRTAVGLDPKSPGQIISACFDAGYAKPWLPVRYEADGKTDNADTLPDFGGDWGKTRTSIHQPRGVARATKPLTGLRCERVGGISASDAVDEGIKFCEPAGARVEDIQYPPGLGDWPEAKRDKWFGDMARATYMAQLEAGKRAIAAYAALWDSLNGDGDFEKNKWVWVLEYPKYEDSK